MIITIILNKYQPYVRFGPPYMTSFNLQMTKKMSVYEFKHIFHENNLKLNIADVLFCFYE